MGAEPAMRVPFAELQQTLEKVLLRYGFSAERASLCATLFAKASLDGVASHGLNRFPLFLKLVEEGYIKVAAEPKLLGSFGPFERWDGQFGPGPLNAWHAMERAISLAQKSGLGCVALRNTNHWMRAGNYGWQAVEAGCIGICFTNTKPNMPAWGGSEPVLGNNPLVVAIPRKKGPIVLDMALSQFSYGKISSYLCKGEQLPYEGGFGENGELTKDPGKILEKELGLPVGLWKGAGFSLVLDILAAVLADGDATHEIGRQEEETGISQVFLCFDIRKLGIEEYPEEKVETIIQNLKASATFEGSKVHYPGEQSLAARQHNLQHGVPVDREIWQEVLAHLPS
ncbi:3-dehydro-L-gulonate 2-dehydrogenase [Nafulsella turpanensis]|uniref:3-dehydro-L-gulonate 2-dehydrogenase n=1 Tax=Nafulsella turpanensis TaxID=1265690 RepID=UPI00034638F4|nr:3-dehydro-L-gulonate 2-dehydrogenase [Nafulsella turpanensis]